MPYNEADYEKAVIQLFEEMKYIHVCGYEVDRDYKNPLYMDELIDALSAESHAPRRCNK